MFCEFCGESGSESERRWINRNLMGVKGNSARDVIGFVKGDGGIGASLSVPSVSILQRTLPPTSSLKDLSHLFTNPQQILIAIATGNDAQPNR
jgi:hypothetical protein